jgi:hypothetical protein
MHPGSRCSLVDLDRDTADILTGHSKPLSKGSVHEGIRTNRDPCLTNRLEFIIDLISEQGNPFQTCTSRLQVASDG